MTHGFAEYVNSARTAGAAATLLRHALAPLRLAIIYDKDNGCLSSVTTQYIHI